MAELKESSLLIKDLKPNMKRVCVSFIVLEIGSPVRIKDGNEVRTVKVADRTGCINMSVWNEKEILLFEMVPDCSAYNENWAKLLDQLPSKKLPPEYPPKT
ncbi:SOSS complex subunit B2 [Taenia crassiceps]|uniref:SOSS complex subunit B2 n=1 Tax=Taenia crassiceps TaxID=6207 RepID=A0ABR4QCC9_9CEST